MNTMVATPTQPDRLLKWMASLADSSRIRLLSLLNEQELGVSEVCEVVQMPQSTVSRHLKILADEGWVVNRRQGTTNLYQMVIDELSPAQRDLWSLTRVQSADWPALSQDRVRLQHLVLEKQQDPTAFFEDAAGHWENIRHELYGSAFTRDAMLGLLPPAWTIADLGCGSGALSVDLSRYVKQVIGIDNSPAMLRAAKQQAKGKDNITLKRGDLTALPLDEASCDAALCVLVLTYLPDPAAALHELARILKPGGRAVVLDLLAHDREAFRRQMGQQHAGFEPVKLSAMLKSAGLTDIRCEPLAPQPEATGPALLLATASKTNA